MAHFQVRKLLVYQRETQFLDAISSDNVILQFFETRISTWNHVDVPVSVFLDVTVIQTDDARTQTNQATDRSLSTLRLDDHGQLKEFLHSWNTNW